MLELTTEDVTQAIETTVETIADGIPDAAQATVSLTCRGLRILQGILMLAAGAILWLVVTFLSDAQRSGALDTVVDRHVRRSHRP